MANRFPVFETGCPMTSGNHGAPSFTQRSSVRISWVVRRVFFFAGGIWVSFLIPAPVSFIAVDLVLAYIPMGLIALWALNRLQPDRS